MTITINGTTGITSPGGDLSVSQGLSGNLNFTGTSNRITGDFSNATVASRVMFQTSTANSSTSIYIIPNGTNTTSQFVAVNNSDPTNASILQLLALSTDIQLRSGLTGSGTYLPMTFYTGGSEKVKIDTSGNVGIGVTPAYRLSSKQSGNTGSASLGVSSINSANDTFIGIGYDSGSDTNRVLSSYISTGAFKPISFWTSDLQRMQIDTSGNVGIGTATTTYRTNIVYTNSAGGVAETGLYLRNTATGNSTQMQFDGHRSYSLLVQGSFGAPAGGFTIQDNTAGVDRLNIDSSGNVLVGTTSNITSGKQTVSFTGSTNNGLVVSESANFSGTVFVNFNLASSVIGSISRVGATSAVIYNTTSDERLKSNISDANPVLDKLMEVKVRQYDWTEGNLHQDAGFIAQELAPILSGIVTEGKTEADMWQLDYSRLTPYLVKAIQELTARLEALENK